jgi:ferric-dicitrate binding protein FerR (iron transport regulator)
MEKEEIKYLALRFLEGTATVEERTKLHDWYNNNLFSETETVMTAEDESSQQVKERLYQQIRERLRGETKQTTVPKRLWLRIAAAASIVLAIGVGIFYYTTALRHPDLALAKNDIAPGKQGATLTLANGKQIRLSDVANGELARESGVVITKSTNGQLVYELKESETGRSKINTLSTAKGETYKLRLPDGSFVWLNSASSLTYSAYLVANGKRTVKLQGEGYFEIAKDKAHPFIVSTNNQQVEVLGTHFNINSYQDEPVVATTLVEGSIKITSDGKQKILKPGQLAVNNGDAIEVSEANIESVTDWKEGDFFLNRVNFKTAMRKIARWYDVEVIYDASVPNDIKSGGWISRDNNLSAVLKSIALTGQVKFRIEGKKIYVSK